MWVFGYSWSTLLWYRCYYPHQSRDALSPVCGIFSCHFVYTFGIFIQKRVLKDFDWWEVDFKTGPIHLKVKIHDAKKKRQVRCQTLSNGLESWRCALRF